MAGGYVPGALTRGVQQGIANYQARQEREGKAEEARELRSLRERQLLLQTFNTLKDVAQAKPGPFRDHMLKNVLGPILGPGQEETIKALGKADEDEFRLVGQAAEDMIAKNKNLDATTLRGLVQTRQIGLPDLFKYGLDLDKKREAEAGREAFAKAFPVRPEGVPEYTPMVSAGTMGAPAPAPPLPTTIEPGGARAPRTAGEAVSVLEAKLQRLDRGIQQYIAQTGRGLSEDEARAITAQRELTTKQLDAVNQRLNPEGTKQQVMRNGVLHDVFMTKSGEITADYGPAYQAPTTDVEKYDQAIRSLKSQGQDESSPAVQAARRALASIGRVKPEDRFATTQAKLVQDREALVRTYGANSPQVNLFDSQLKAERSGAKLTDESTMRGQYQHLAKEYITVRDAYNRVQAAVKGKTPAADIAALYAYNKILDPGSVVRETEFRIAAQAGSYGERMKRWVTMALDGTMTDKQRDDIAGRSRDLYGAQEKTQQALDKQFHGIATRAGIDPNQILGAEGERFIQPAGGGGADDTDILRGELSGREAGPSPSRRR